MTALITCGCQGNCLHNYLSEVASIVSPPVKAVLPLLGLFMALSFVLPRSTVSTNDSFVASLPGRPSLSYRWQSYSQLCLFVARVTHSSTCSLPGLLTALPVRCQGYSQLYLFIAKVTHSSTCSLSGLLTALPVRCQGYSQLCLFVARVTHSSTCSLPGLLTALPVRCQGYSQLYLFVARVTRTATRSS